MTLATVAMADTPDTGTLGQLEDIQQHNYILSSQAETARLEKQIRDSNGISPAFSGDPIASSSASVATPGGLPTTDSIAGRNGVLMATLTLPNGAHIDARAGDKIAGTAWIVTRITLNGVWISDGSTVTSLAFSQ
ncbi:type IV pilus biogenesis protein PilP [Citrobacter koseri]|uniref:type IV pilus biogenesis protein PilP n=1 Tax=Citrobacter koseri TaxID=545 RepID=UPI001F31E132|nr:type IV pilus biogenesis protein PilP [Citrobacter koseri]